MFLLRALFSVTLILTILGVGAGLYVISTSIVSSSAVQQAAIAATGLALMVGPYILNSLFYRLLQIGFFDIDHTSK